jgi:type IV fimbrial biogenesis protein FimT
MAMKFRGFSLAELLVALAIAAVLLALAVPGFGQQRADAALRSAARQTLAAVHLARRLALARGESVTVCPAADGMRCGFGGTQWLLFANQPAGVDSRREEGELILRKWQLPARVVVSGSRGYAAFQPRPGAAATVTFEFTHPGRPAASIRLIISQTGRPRIEGQ